MARRRHKAEDPSARVRNLVAIDATNVMRRLAARREEMVTLFSRLRQREPMLQTVSSWFGSIGFGELCALPARSQAAVSAFYESLGELRWYLQYTEDMPLTVRKTALQHQRRLEVAYAGLIEVLGAPDPDGAPVVDADVVAREEREPPALASGSKSHR